VEYVRVSSLAPPSNPPAAFAVFPLSVELTIDVVATPAQIPPPNPPERLLAMVDCVMVREWPS